MVNINMRYPTLERTFFSTLPELFSEIERMLNHPYNKIVFKFEAIVINYTEDGYWLSICPKSAIEDLKQ